MGINTAFNELDFLAIYGGMINHSGMFSGAPANPYTHPADDEMAGYYCPDDLPGDIDIGSPIDMVRGLAAAAREMLAAALARLVEFLLAAAAALLVARANKLAIIRAGTIPLSDLLPPARLPAAHAGHNITPEIVPAPRT